jgi:OTU domain-containing protein 5
MHTTTLGIGTLLRREPQALGKWATRFHQYLQEWSQYAMKKLYMRLEQGFPSLLLEKGLVIKQVQGDGNCMFRAISD